MKKLAFGVGLIVFMVGAFFVYDYFIRINNPCGQLFEQTSASLSTRIELLEEENSLQIGRNNIQQLSASAQQVALNLQSCCIAAQTKVISSDQFLQCQVSTNQYDNQLEAILERLAVLEEEQPSDQPMASNDVVAMAPSVSKRMNTQAEMARSLSPLSKNAPQAMAPATTVAKSATSVVKKPTEVESLVNGALDISNKLQKQVQAIKK